MFVGFLLKTFLRRSTADKTEMESLVRGRNAEWTIIRPAVLTDKPATSALRVFSASTHDRARSATRHDLATFLVAQLIIDDHLGQAIANQ